MQKLLELLIEGRVEDTLTECICYIVLQDSDGGIGFAQKLFRKTDIAEVKIISQLSLKVDVNERIIPDIVISIKTQNGAWSHVIIESKYGDDLDEKKSRYFNYFESVSNCELMLLCNEYDQDTHRKKMDALNLNFSRILTFKEVADCLSPTLPKAIEVKEFVLRYATRRSRRDESIQELQGKGLIGTQLLFAFPSKEILLNIWNQHNNRPFKSLKDAAASIHPLEFTFEKNADKGPYFSIFNYLQYGALLTNAYPSEEIQKSPLVFLRRNLLGYEYPQTIDFSSNEKKILDFFFTLLLGIKAQGNTENYAYQTTSCSDVQNRALAVGIKKSFCYLDVVFSDEVYLRLLVTHSHAYEHKKPHIEEMLRHIESTYIPSVCSIITGHGDYCHGKAWRINVISNVPEFFKAILNVFY